MPGFNGELYFDRRLPVTHLPTVFCAVFIILFGCLVARGIREISVGVFQFDMGNIGRLIRRNQSFWQTFMKRV